MIFILANYTNSQNSNSQLFSDSSNPIKIQQLAQKQRFNNSYGNQSTCPRKLSGFDLPITSVNGIAVVLTTSEAPGGFLQKSIPLVNILQNWPFQKNILIITLSHKSLLGCHFLHFLYCLLHQQGRPCNHPPQKVLTTPLHISERYEDLCKQEGR